jgi:hypothetical protein
MMRIGRWALFLLLVALPCAAAPERPLVGVWITDLYDLDATNRSFTAKFWIWSVLPAGSKINPVKTMTVRHARQLTTFTPVTLKEDGKDWTLGLVTAVVQHHWDTRSFPFDRHTLEIVIEDAVYDDSLLEYVVDRKQSGTESDCLPRSWKATGFRLMTDRHTYRTTFGDPVLSAPRSQWSQLVIQVDVQREAVGIFVKLLVGAYVAFLLSLLSFRIKTDQPTLFSARLALLVGSLFATVVNLRSTESVIGRSEHFTLVDKIHFTIALYILASAIAALVSRREHDRERPERAIARDRVLMVVFGVSFLAINVALIWRAMAS